MARRRTRYGSLLAVLLLLRAAGAEEEPLRVEAVHAAPLSDLPAVTIRIEADGRAAIRTVASPDAAAIELDLSLTESEMADLRRRVAASRFFEDWPPWPGPHQAWDVTVSLGAARRRRERVDASPEFEPLGQFLARFVAQAQTVRELRRGDFYLPQARIRAGHGVSPIRPADLVPEFVRCAAAQEKPYACARAASILVTFVPAAQWKDVADGLLDSLDGERRAAVMLAWWQELEEADRPEHRTVLVEATVREVVAQGPEWSALPESHRAALGSLLAVVFRERRQEAFALAEGLARTLGTLDRPFTPPGLLATGEAAIPSVLRLLADARAETRLSAVHLAHMLIHYASGRTYYRVDLPAAELPALKERLGREVVPVLETLARDARQPFAIRSESFAALDHWHGRDRAAELRRADRAASEQRAKEDAARRPLPAPRGDLRIEGRVLGSGDVPFEGFNVAAMVFADESTVAHVGSASTGPDGSFRIVGLPAGTYDVAAAPPSARLSARMLQANGSRRRGVVAGTTDLVLRFEGGMIRGRLLGPSGDPMFHRTVITQMRDGPNELQPFTATSGFAETDPLGRFWFLQLVPGVYDVEVPGLPPLRGAAAVRPGPDELTVQVLEGVAISGRVVDERGDPLEEVDVAVHRLGTYDALVATRADAEGRFRLAGLDPAKTYDVRASLRNAAPGGRHGAASGVSAGAADVVVAIDTTPHLRLRVDRAGRGRGASTHWIRLLRHGEGSPPQRSFEGPEVHWRAAPQATWIVQAQVRDVDAEGRPASVWLDLGQITTGDPHRTFTVPP